MRKLNAIQLLEAGPAPETEETGLQEIPVETEETEKKKHTFPKMPEWMEKIKLKPFPWKGLNAKNALIAGCLVLIAVAGFLNIRYGLMEKDSEAVDPPSNLEEAAVNDENFFATAIIDRERVRDEALEVLVSITEDETADEAAKADAFTAMERIAQETSSEIDIENLVKAKGFTECVAVINGEDANIVVKSEGLTAAEIAQIKEIVYLEADILPKNIKIIERNS